ncbi:unnamed protein product [Phytomonas sp. Hart1]|nr:unnamed protein product [Phytomonas sp. Hart1]|eukprot:CCW67378.1 unnamed protein product [Phytomonas sp. isolate Hart1]
MFTEQDAMPITQSQEPSMIPNTSTQPQNNEEHSRTKTKKKSKKSSHHRTIPRAPHRQLFLTDTSQLLPFHISKKGRMSTQQLLYQKHEGNATHPSRAPHDPSVFLSTSSRVSTESQPHHDPSLIPHSTLSKGHEGSNSVASDAFFYRNAQQGELPHGQSHPHDIHETQPQGKDLGPTRSLRNQLIYADRFFYISEPVELQIESMSGPCVRLMLFLWYFTFLLCVGIDMFPRLRWDMLDICNSESVSLKNLGQWSSTCFETQPSLSKPGHFNVTWVPNIQEDRVTPYYALRHVVVSTPRPSTLSSPEVRYNELVGVITGDDEVPIVLGPMETTLYCSEKNSLCDVLKLPGGVMFPFRGLFFPELSPELMNAMTGGSSGMGPSASIGIFFERKSYTIVSVVCRYCFMAFSMIHMLRFTVYRRYTSHLYEQSWIIGLQIFLIFYLNPLFVENLSAHPFSGILHFFEASLPTCFVAMNLAFMFSVMTASMLWEQNTDKCKAVHEKDMTVDSDKESLNLYGTIRSRSCLTTLYKFLFCSKNLYDPPLWTKLIAVSYVFFILLYQIVRSINSPDYAFAGTGFSVKLGDINWCICALVLGCLICFGLLFYLNNHLGKKPYLETRPQQLACCMFLMIFLFIILFYIANCITLYAYVSRFYPVTNPYFPFTHLTSLTLNTLFVNIMTFVYTTQPRDDNVPIHPNDERWMFMVWPHTWHTWLARHGGSQYIFFTERQETNFYKLQLDFHKRQLLARLKRKRDTSVEKKHWAHGVGKANLDKPSSTMDRSQIEQTNQTEGLIDLKNHTGNIIFDHKLTSPYTKEAKQNEDTLALPSISKMATSGKSQSLNLQKEHFPDSEIGMVPIRIKSSLSPSECNLPNLVSSSVKNEQENLPYGISPVSKPSCKHSRVGSKVGFIEENLNHCNGTRKGDMKKGLGCMDCFSSSYLPELPEDDNIYMLSRSRRHVTPNDKIPLLNTSVELHASNLVSPRLVCGVEGHAKHSAYLESSTKRACIQAITESARTQFHSNQLVPLSPPSHGMRETPSREGYSLSLSATDKDGSSVRSVGLMMGTLHSRTPTPQLELSSSHCGHLSLKHRGACKRARSHDCNIAPMATSRSKQSIKGFPVRTPREVLLTQPSDDASSVGSEYNRSTFQRAVNKVHLGINKLVGVAERNLVKRPMHHIGQLQKIVLDAFYKPFESSNYLPFFNLETAIDCFNLSWEVYHLEYNNIVEYEKTDMWLNLNNVFQVISSFFRCCLCRGHVPEEVSDESNKHLIFPSVSKDPHFAVKMIDRTDNERVGSEFIGKQPSETGKASHVNAKIGIISNIAPYKVDEKRKQMIYTLVGSSVVEKINNDADACVKYPNGGNSASRHLEANPVKPQTNAKGAEQLTMAPSAFSHSAQPAPRTARYEQSTSEVIPDKPHLPTGVLPMCLERYGYIPIWVTQIKEVQVLIAKIDTNAPEHLYKAPRIVISLRGTANWSNARDDMKIERLVWDEMVEDIAAMNDSDNDDSLMLKLKSRAFMGCASLGRVWKPSCHGGFLTIWKAMRPVVIGKLLEVLQGDPDTVYRVFTTGHSLGGGLASLCAYSVTRELHRIKYPIQEVTVYSYGTPRIGNTIFCRLYNHMVPRTFRVTNESDLVATMGIFCDSHVGIEVKIDRNGNYIVKPTDIEKIFPPTKGTGLSVMNHLMSAYGASLNTIAMHSQCLARCWNPYLTKASDTEYDECVRCGD